MKTAKDYQQEFRLKNDELAQFDEFLNDPKRTCFHGKEYLICKDPDPEGNFIIVGVNFRILPAGTPIVTKDGSIIQYNKNKKDRMIISYPSTILIEYLTAKRNKGFS